MFFLYQAWICSNLWHKVIRKPGSQLNKCWVSVFWVHRNATCGLFWQWSHSPVVSTSGKFIHSLCSLEETRSRKTLFAVKGLQVQLLCNVQISMSRRKNYALCCSTAASFYSHVCRMHFVILGNLADLKTKFKRQFWFSTGT